jgi:hypothetical protein
MRAVGGEEEDSLGGIMAGEGTWDPTQGEMRQNDIRACEQMSSSCVQKGRSTRKQNHRHLGRIGLENDRLDQQNQMIQKD